MMRNRPPSLKALSVLEAVVRNGSVTAAASELRVTSSAVSKQIALLEAWLGQSLMENRRPRAVPTDVARRLSAATGEALEVLDSALDAIRGQPPSRVLVVAAPYSFAIRWLIPRVHGFDRPGICVRVRPTHTPEDWDALDCDIVIRRGAPIAGQLHAEPLCRECLILVAKPEIAHLTLDNGLPLIEAETRQGELSAWLKAAGANATCARSARRYPHFYIALEAALASRGAIVAAQLVVDDLVAKGELIDVYPSIRLPGVDYHVAMKPETSDRVAADAFIDWLMRQASIPQSIGLAAK